MANPTSCGGFKKGRSAIPGCRPRRSPEASPSLYHCERKSEWKRAMAERLDALLSDLLSTHPHDPANARYVVPLENPEDEEMARAAADATYEAYAADHFTDDTPQEVADRIYEQALIDSRRMIVDEDYEGLIIETG